MLCLFVCLFHNGVMCIAFLLKYIDERQWQKVPKKRRHNVERRFVCNLVVIGTVRYTPVTYSYCMNNQTLCSL